MMTWDEAARDAITYEGLALVGHVERNAYDKGRAATDRDYQAAMDAPELGGRVADAFRGEA
ncbi:hypothetical protein ACIBEJ_34235 [Nonomuraea sp. NPDC050790]|uniref:hypothetical protein n=1 Tax=Nonomuraea sp. NPDC050790 TaxID=3364371 RepID=UPI003790D845